MNRDKNIEEDIKYMTRALQLAHLAEGHTAPNPMVGAVVVENGEIIGEGYHRKCGEPHAEVNAINSVKQRERLKNSTIYVTLEPCSHYGKTPPCTEKIIANEIPRVVIGSIDPFAKVNGQGVKILKEAGIEVEVGVMEKESTHLNRRFFTYHSKKRPYIILKWAQTCDGYIDNDRSCDSPMSWLTGTACKEMVHKMRKEEGAIMVGSNTVRRDNPSLTIRDWSGENPVRVVIDRELKLEKEYNIFNAEAKTLVFNSKMDKNNYIKIDFESPDFLEQILAKLHELEIQSLIVEGGTTLLNMFINSDLYDEAIIFVSPLSLQELKYGTAGDGVKAPQFAKGHTIKSKNIEGVIVKKIVKSEYI
ncbi:MAG: bifunctional diaminohydroxyphosphoribosylaminopyrimidine deaminase/5-amino-6-(5-phosphoribosylamino)uracil reductase RibD [Rikenellaceae bacterium]